MTGELSFPNVSIGNPGNSKRMDPRLHGDDKRGMGMTVRLSCRTSARHL